MGFQIVVSKRGYFKEAIPVNSKPPLVSIIMPTYDRYDLARGALSNVCQQTYNDIEIIVIEDGSNSGIENYIIQLNDKRFKYYRHSKRKGLAAARNTGIKMSRGIYVAFIDDDDRWVKEKLKHQMEINRKDLNRKCMIFCNIYDGKKKESLSIINDNVELKLMSEYIFRGYLIPSSSMLVSHKDIVSIGGFSEDLTNCIDHDIWMKMAKAGFYMIKVNRSLVYNKKHDQSRMVTRIEERLRGINEFFRKWKSYVSENYGLENWYLIIDKYDDATLYIIKSHLSEGKISKNKAYYYIKIYFEITEIPIGVIDKLFIIIGLCFFPLFILYSPVTRKYNVILVKFSQKINNRLKLLIQGMPKFFNKREIIS